MRLSRRAHTVANIRRYIIDYSDWLEDGTYVSSAAVTSSDTAIATITDMAIAENRVIFFVNGGVLNETFTVSVAMTDSLGQVKNDTLEFFCVAP